MYYKFCFQVSARCYNSLPGRTSTLPLADCHTLIEDLRAPCTMNGAIHTSASHQPIVSRIYNGIDFKQCDISHHVLDFFHTLFFVSMIIVTGPSFTRLTFISAPNSPVCTSLPRFDCTTLTKDSYNGIAISGFAAFMYEGRFPFFILACNVNWLTTRISPFTSFTPTFITPCSSLKIRRFTIFDASQSMSSRLSASSTPSNTSKPEAMVDLILFSIVTDAAETR